jgi:hypothetical protein
MPIIPPIGKRFDKLTVVGLGEPRKVTCKGKSSRRASGDVWYETTWLCLCDCGASKTCTPTHLKQGRVKSCGCGRPKHQGNMVAIMDMYTMYKSSAKKRCLDFSLSLEVFIEITSSPCHYCGEPPSNLHYSRHKRINADNLPYISNGIDRVDNNLGYADGNCVPCCAVDNQMKTNRSASFFVEHCRKVLEHSKSKNTILQLP